MTNSGSGNREKAVPYVELVTFVEPTVPMKQKAVLHGEGRPLVPDLYDVRLSEASLEEPGDGPVDGTLFLVWFEICIFTGE